MPTFRGRWVDNEPMARHVSWKAGGIARRACFPEDVHDLQIALSSLSPQEPILWVGLGSNLLVREGGFAGTVIFTHPKFQQLSFAAGGVVEVECGVAGAKLARRAQREGWGGVQFLAGIPGTLGGALAMNAGCFGTEMWSWVTEVRTINRQGVITRRTPHDFAIAYRSVALRVAQDKGDEWFISATLQLPALNSEDRPIENFLLRRAQAQPLQWPNAGSVFKNPPGDHAARLIEAAGLKGLTVGGAQVSHKHANFILNFSGLATATDIEALIVRVQEEVEKHSGVRLETEVRIVGENL